MLLITAASVMFGAVYSLTYVSFMPDLPAIGASFSGEGVIADYPRFRLSSSVIETNTKQGLVIVSVPPFPEYKRGDRVRLSGSVSSVRGRKIYLNYPVISRIDRNENLATYFFGSARFRLLSNLAAALPVENAALAAGLLLGDDSGFSRGFRADLKKTGTIHIVALSGWNIAIVISVLGRLSSLIFRRRLAIAVSGIGVIFLILVAGPSASLIRAGIMGFVFILASFVGREYSARNAVFFAAALMVFEDPSVPAYDLGFQLSFLAVLGMIYLAPLFSSWFAKMKFGRIAVVSGFSDSLAAQIAIFPVALSGALTVSPVGIFANAAVLFLVPYAFFLSLAAAVAGSGVGIISWMFSFGANAVLSYEINAIHLLGNLF